MSGTRRRETGKRRRTLGDEPDVDGVVVRTKRDEYAAGTPRDQEDLGEVVGNLRFAGLDHGTRNADVVVRELEKFVVAQFRHLLARASHVVGALARHEKSFEPWGKRRWGGILRGELGGHADIVLGHGDGRREGRCRCFWRKCARRLS